jgi:signal transduction histidine kinase
VTIPVREYRARVDDELQRLLESRARLVACSDNARAELGRALHDGAQQRVVAVSLMLRALKGRLDDPEAVALVDQAIEELGLTGEELRDLARRLHPVALTDRGLGPALFAASTRAPVPVELDVPEERFPGEIERAAYDVVIGAIECASEAGSHLHVSLERQNGHVALDVSGCGAFDADRLCALADRVETIRGSLEVDGPMLRARFPVASG